MRNQLLAVAAFAGSLTAQTTWIVDAGGGPGVNFTDLPSAVQAASDGDTILVHTGPFQEGATPFQTSKGLTIVGVGGLVPITTSSANSIRIVSLPAGSTFRMVGFSRPSDGALHFDVIACLGKVHLERIRCRENQSFLTGPSTVIHQSQNVTLRRFDTFGAPCVRISDSRVSLVECRLGETYIGLGGGQAVQAFNSRVDIVQPMFDPLISSAPTVMLLNCDTRIAGSLGSFLRNPVGVAVSANGGSLLVDPTVTITVPGVGTAFQGSTLPTFESIPATWTENANPGQQLVLNTVAEPGAFVFLAIGQQGSLVDTPLGTLGIDPAQAFGFLPGASVPAVGPLLRSLLLPATLPLGSTHTTQAVVLQNGQLLLGEPATFVTH